MLSLPLDTIVMLGPILEVLFLPRYVRSVSGDFVMLGPISEALFFLVMLDPFQETLLC